MWPYMEINKIFRFRGQLAPENLKRLLFEAVTTTQVKAAECYRWVYEKVQATLG